MMMLKAGKRENIKKQSDNKAISMRRLIGKKDRSAFYGYISHNNYLTFIY